jgi:hypothetical protein
LPHNEGNKMMDSAWPRMRARILAIAVAGAIVGAAAPRGAYAQPQRRGDGEAQPSSSFRRNSSHSQHPRAASAASAPIVRTNTPFDFGTQQRDGHLTPEERRLLRQHIEDAVRELYKR